MRGPGTTPALMALRRPDVDEVAAAQIAYRGEAGHQRIARVHGGADGPLRDGTPQAQQRGAVVIRVERVRQVRVGVDEAWQQRGVSQVDHRGPGRNGPAYRNHLA